MGTERCSGVNGDAMKRRNVITVVVGLASAVSLVGALPATAAEPGADCGSYAHVAVNELTPACSSFVEVVDVTPGRSFTVPDEGTAVTFSAVTAEGSPSVDDVTIARSDDGQVAVEVGEDGEASHQIYGTTSVLDDYATPDTSEILTVTPQATAPKCDSYEYSVNAYRWTGTLQWRYKTPSFGGQASVSAGFQAMANGTGACGANKPNSAAASYLGTTTTASSVGSNNICGSGDYTNVVDSGSLPSGTLAATCTYKTPNQIFAADIKISTNYSWYTGASDTGCSGSKYDLQGIVTHEAGHAFGLNHVSQASNQVMKPNSGTCEAGQRKLGNGDLAGMKKLYP